MLIGVLVDQSPHKLGRTWSQSERKSTLVALWLLAEDGGGGSGEVAATLRSARAAERLTDPTRLRDEDVFSQCFCRSVLAKTMDAAALCGRVSPLDALASAEGVMAALVVAAGWAGAEDGRLPE